MATKKKTAKKDVSKKAVKKVGKVGKFTPVAKKPTKKPVAKSKKSKAAITKPARPSVKKKKAEVEFDEMGIGFTIKGTGFVGKTPSLDVVGAEPASATGPKSTPYSDPTPDLIAPPEPTPEPTGALLDVPESSNIKVEVGPRLSGGYVEKYDVRAARQLGREVRRPGGRNDVVDVVVAFTDKVLAVMRFYKAYKEGKRALGDAYGRVMLLHTASTPAETTREWRESGFRNSGVWVNALVNLGKYPTDSIKDTVAELEKKLGLTFSEKAASRDDLPEVFEDTLIHVPDEVAGQTVQHTEKVSHGADHY